MIVAHTCTTRPVQKNRIGESALTTSVRTNTVNGGEKREIEGKEVSATMIGRTGIFCHFQRFFHFFLADFSSFSLFFPSLLDRVSSNHGLEACQEANSFEPAKWSDRRTKIRVN